MTARLIVDHPGLMTTVQDMGRFGTQALGVPVSGALDIDALRLANALVGNPPNAAALEIRMVGPTLQVTGGPARVALTGTQVPIEIISETATTIPAGQSALLSPGTRFRIGATRDTGVCYLGVQGSFAIVPELGSLSTYLPGKMGGVQGRALVKGDALPIGGDLPTTGAERRSDQSVLANVGPVRVILGPQDDYFTPPALRTFLTSRYKVTARSNRMGLQLDGATLSHARGYNIASDGIVAGSIQVTGTGQPIILLADRQTTGGYPKIATVISADLPRLGRMTAGQTINFTPISVEDAETLRRIKEEQFQHALEALETVMPRKTT